MRATYLHLLSDLVAAYGADTVALARGLDLQAITARGERGMQLSAFDALCERALDLTGDPALGLRFGERLNISAHGVLGLALMSSATVADALGVLVRYFRILSPASDLALSHNGDVYRLDFAIRGQSPVAQRFRSEALIGSVYTSSQFLLNRPIPGTTVQLAYSRPAHHAQYQTSWPQTQICFDAPTTAITFPLAAGEWAIATANPAVADIFRQQCEALLRPLTGTGVVSNRVRHVLMRTLDAPPGIGAVARALAMSERSLRRRLDEEHTTYRRLIDEVRAEMASQYLRQTTLPVTEISRMLGFDNVANFRRAFRRWHGVTPQFRRDSGATEERRAPR